MAKADIASHRSFLMIQIAHIASDFLPVRGGAEVYLHNLLRALDRPGRTQTVFQIDTGVRDPRMAAVGRFPGPLGRRRGPALWWFNVALHAHAATLRRYDLLVVHYPFHVAGVWFHPRIIALSHGVEWMQPPRRFSHRLRRLIARWAVKRACATVANDTNFLREMQIPSPPGERPFAEHQPGVWFVPNAVDPGKFAPAAGEAAGPPLEERSTILVPRNCSPARGIHLAIQAFGLYAARHPQARLLIAGNPPAPRYGEQLRALIAQRSMEARVEFAGHIDTGDMAALYRQTRMTLVPSLFCEGTSLAALESMASGTPTISTHIGGLADLPTVQCDCDPASLFQAMEETDANLAAVANRQREAVRETFSIGRWTDAWNQIVESALAK